MRMRKRWAWIGGAVCLAVSLLLSSCGGKDHNTSATADDLFSGPPPSQSDGTFTFNARGGSGAGTGKNGGAGGGIDVTPKADPENVGDGSMSDPVILSTVLSQIFTVECQTAGGFGEAKFSVVGSVLGNIGTAISDQEFVDAENRVRFTITTGFNTPWAIGDKFTFKGPPRIKLNGANVRLIKAGSVDTSFTVPSEPIVLGSNPRTIIGNETIQLVDQPPFCPTPHNVTIPGDNPELPATELWVLPNATLIFVPVLGCKEGVLSVGFEGDVLIEGTVTTTVVTGSDKARLSLTTQRNLIVKPGASLDTRGEDRTTGNGGDGGDIELTAAGKIILQDFIDSSGGDGPTGGGDGGSIFLTAGFDLFNVGIIKTDGGTASFGTGGNAGEIQFASNSDSFLCSFKGMFNLGNLTAHGGDGLTGGGKGGDISLEAGICGRGNLLNAGVLSADGGNTIGTGSAGNGGEAGDLSLKADATLLSSGSLSANGGVGVGTGFFGGNGGAISIVLTNPEPDSIQIAASLSANGGEGQDKATGGAGSPSMTIDSGEGDLHLLNFISLDLSGGDGKSRGGVGGRLIITASNQAGSNGILFNEPQIMAMGGEGTGSTGDGRVGGSITLSSAASLINYGEVTLNGGGGGAEGGLGGSVHLASISSAGELGKVLNTAKLSANGGAASSPTKGVGGTGGEVFIRAVKLAANQGILSANGGDSPFIGGAGGMIGISAVSQTVNSGKLSADGGNRTDTGSEGDGGKGGNGGIIVLSTQAQPTSNSGVLSVVQGTGSSTAAPGQIQID